MGSKRNISTKAHIQWWEERKQLLSENSTRNMFCEPIWIVIQQQAENNKNCECKLQLRLL